MPRSVNFSENGVFMPGVKISGILRKKILLLQQTILGEAISILQRYGGPCMEGNFISESGSVWIGNSCKKGGENVFCADNYLLNLLTLK